MKTTPEVDALLTSDLWVDQLKTQIEHHWALKKLLGSVALCDRVIGTNEAKRLTDYLQSKSLMP